MSSSPESQEAPIPVAEAEDNFRVLTVGKPELKWKDNSTSSSKYTIWTFLPKALGEQFRRKGNVVFLAMGLLMFIGANTNLFDTAATPWTLLIPLFVVLTISLLQEAYADYLRHRSDNEVNNHPCLILQHEDSDERSNMPNDNNVDENATVINFTEVPRKNIYAGHLVLVKNREMIPADIVLLASSNENGSAYIETSSIDGETNLKLRLSPSSYMYGNAATTLTMEDVVSQLNMLTTLGYPNGIAAIKSQSISEYSSERRNAETQTEGSQRGSLFRSFRRHSSNMRSIDDVQSIRFVTKLVSETPNASVNTFTGKLIKPNGEEVSTTVPLDADNLLLRGAVLRNTEWVIGVACFTGEDTKLPEMFDGDKNYNTKRVSSFDAEMFLRTMSICHTAMVEQDLDKKKSDIQVGESSDGGGKSISLGR